MTDGTKPFGVVATFVIGTIALLVGQLSGLAALSGWYGLNLKEVGALSQYGGAIVLFIFVSAPVQVALLALAASHKGSVAEYLGYKLPRRGELVAAVLVLAALIIVGDTVSWLAGRHIVDRFQSDIYQAAKSANLLPLLLIAITVLIPISEETLFPRISVSRMAEILTRCLAGYSHHGGDFCDHSRSVRLVSHSAGVRFRRVFWMGALGERFNHFDHAPARAGKY